MTEIIWPLLVLAVLGGALGLALAIASKKFRVEVDPRIDEVQEALPGVNCGACGYPGCSGYAEAIVTQGAEINLCAPGAEAVINKIAKIMGLEASHKEPNYAIVCCDGNGVNPRFHYNGVPTCKAASVMGLAGSFQDCPFGCLGFGSCIEACPFGAISLNENNVAVINEDLCSACGKCVEACPRDLIRIDPESRVIVVRCMNLDKGAKANKQCNHSCIACGKCVRECPFDAIHIENNLAVIDYDKCKLCGKCVKVCPKELIVNLRQPRKERKTAREQKAESQ